MYHIAINDTLHKQNGSAILTSEQVAQLEKLEREMIPLLNSIRAQLGLDPYAAFCLCHNDLSDHVRLVPVPAVPHTANTAPSMQATNNYHASLTPGPARQHVAMMPSGVTSAPSSLRHTVSALCVVSRPQR